MVASKLHVFSTVEAAMMANSTHDLHETEWEAYDEQLSPLGHSSSSVFSGIHWMTSTLQRPCQDVELKKQVTWV
ncbi:UNVERIFIED_CONTAM: hypothetical protein Sradi_0420600 [Sesamum radiatum]|uniref:Uncharacterized protein n=1 Tax=Sesamum radiatum TaxID=300843 RepID=A0AAW2W5I2_SESRA